jgi:hypothetical protein
MARRFYTEKDIARLYESGERSLAIDQNVVLTDAAYEKARSLGLVLISDQVNPSPSAPVRPYLSKYNQPAVKEPVQPGAPVATVQEYIPTPPSDSEPGELHSRIRKAVSEKLGDQVDVGMVEEIIRRVLKSTGMQ